jgi:hypothetical protein
VIRAIRAFFHEVDSFRRWVKVCVLHASGRWFYFRDQPEWFVIRIATFPLTRDMNTEVRAIVLEARAEYQRRLNRMFQSFKVDMHLGPLRFLGDDE